MEEAITLMAKVSWIKIEIEMFSNRKIKQIRKMPEGNNIVLIWVMLLTMAGRCNSNGIIFLTENIPYTTKMLADELDFEESIIQLALTVLEKFGMITRDSELLSIPVWEEHQSADELEKIRDQNRKRVAEYRERQKNKAALLCKKDDVTLQKRYSNITVTEQNKNKDKDLELDLEKELDIEKEKKVNDLIVSKDTICQNDIQQIITEWNKLEEFGIAPVKRMTSKREQAAKARIRQNQMEDILEAIENIRHSSFLQGQNKDGWMITFDWFLKPGNFAKVFEGNYLDKSGNKPQSYMEKIQNRISEVDSWV
jgi:predicted phage replisome organizer